MEVSVIIPTHDRRAMVVEAVSSVLAQDVAPAEVIVVDDGSTDGTADELGLRFGEHVKIISIANSGPAAARNAGALAARGAWLAFLDSDDLWLPGKLAAQLDLIQREPTIEICHTDDVWLRDGRRVNARMRHRKPGGRIFAASLRVCLVSPSAVLMRRSLFDRVGRFDEGLAACEDYDLWLRISRDTLVALVDVPLVVRRGGHPDQLSRRFWGMDRFRIAAIARVLSEGGLAPDDRALALEVLREKCAILAQGARRRDREEEAVRYERIAAAWSDATCVHTPGVIG